MSINYYTNFNMCEMLVISKANQIINYDTTSYIKIRIYIYL